MKRFTFATLLLLFLAAPAFAVDAPDIEEEKTLYAVGLAVARSLAVFNLSESELKVVTRGITDAVTGKKTEVDLTAYAEKVQELARARRKVQGEKMAVAGKQYLEKATTEKGAVTTASGMVFIPLAEGSGASPKAADTVKVNYRGTLPDGTEFDSSYKRGKPLEFKLDQVIKCWTEALQKMKPGGKARLVCPPSIAYGEKGAGELILPDATLVFEVELLETKAEKK